jgi:hypothetical protein
MIPPPQSEYFITEEMVQCIEAWTKKYPIVSKDIASVIRSRPYNSQSEREKVLVMLSEFENWIQRGYSRRGIYEEETLEKLRVMKEELRSKGGEP